jgi:hypothetical protein
MLGLECLKLENEWKKGKENHLFDNSSPSVLIINWQMAIPLKKQKSVVGCCVVLKNIFNSK